MAKSPMVEAAVIVLDNHGSEITFNELWEKVIVEMDLDKESATKRIAKLYSDLTLDKRVISLPDNKWDLRRRRKFDEIIIDTSDIIIEDNLDLETEDYDDYGDADYDDGDEDDDEDDDEIELEIFDDEVLDEEYDEDIEEFKEIAINSED